MRKVVFEAEDMDLITRVIWNSRKGKVFYTIELEYVKKFKTKNKALQEATTINEFLEYNCYF